MAIEITGRHVSVTEAIREYAARRLDKLTREFPRLDNVHMILDLQKYLHIAELVVHAPRHIRLEAREESDDMYVSIDRVADKIEKQLRRIVDRIHDRKNHGAASREEAPPAETIEA